LQFSHTIAYDAEENGRVRILILCVAVGANHLTGTDPGNTIRKGNSKMARCIYCNKNIPIEQIEKHQSNCLQKPKNNQPSHFRNFYKRDINLNIFWPITKPKT